MTIPRSSLTGYIFDQTLQTKAIQEQRNYWYTYIEEIFDELGLAAAALTRAELSDASQLARFKFLFVDLHDMSAAEQTVLQEWVAHGGTLVGFAVQGADELFGIRFDKLQPQPDDDFTIAGYVQFPSEEVPNEGAGGPLSNPWYRYRDTLLPIFSPLSLVDAGQESQTTAILLNAGKRTMSRPAILEHRIGQGHTWYFAFDLPQTLWVMHQGRPIDRDYDGDGYYRTGDAIPFSRVHDLSLPYGDYWLQFLEELLTRQPQPFIHQLPPFQDGSVPDLLLHYGGDDECAPDYQVIASNYMKAKGLPYQMNLMPVDGKFAIDKEEYAAIQANGHDLSVHFDFVKPHFHYTEGDIEEQIKLYEEAFGETPIASVNHWLTSTGWAEHARWSYAHGMKGDNSRAHTFTPPYNPINVIGFGFGTVYPHFVYDDYKHGNAKIPFVNIPIGFFEPRIYEESREADIKRIHDALDRAAHFRWTLNMFIHPVYIADDTMNEHCLPALDEMLDYLRQRQYRAVHQSTNQLCLWWHARSQTNLNNYEISQEPDGETVVTFEVKTGAEAGVLVKLPVPHHTKEHAVILVNEEQKQGVWQRQSGRMWLHIHVPQGEHRVKAAWKG
ncbi:hypothetical protein [Paenibacillus koleovorans]|uniref:hypothetical protein n=1 Tax=Paenibacillus koleovorans TaxID=121608 RepID=UPI000FDC23DB|nr:hypothetical protein [Paenibacillus koleovorans]